MENRYRSKRGILQECFKSGMKKRMRPVNQLSYEDDNLYYAKNQSSF